MGYHYPLSSNNLRRRNNPNEFLRDSTFLLFSHDPNVRSFCWRFENAPAPNLMLASSQPQLANKQTGTASIQPR